MRLSREKNWNTVEISNAAKALMWDDKDDDYFDDDNDADGDVEGDDDNDATSSSSSSHPRYLHRGRDSNLCLWTSF